MIKKLTRSLKKLSIASFAFLLVGSNVVPLIQPTVAHATSDGILKFQVRAHGLPNNSATALVQTQVNDLGDCGGRFSGYAVIPVTTDSVTTCTGVDYYVPYVQNGPQGTYISKSSGNSANFTYIWTVASDTSGGSTACYGYGCVLNFNSGTVTLNLDISPRADLAKFGYVITTLPSLSINAVTDSSVKLSWTPAVNTKTNEQIADYWIYKNDGTNAPGGWSGNTMVPPTTTTYAATGLQACSVYQFVIVTTEPGGRDFSNLQTVRTTGCPPLAPPSPDTLSAPDSSNVTSSDASYNWGGDSYSNAISNSIINMDQANPKLPPTAPNSFTIAGTKGNSAVSLGWTPSDSTSVVHYTLERSTDNRTWITLDDSIAADGYNDLSTQFETLYYYRLTAIDEHDLYSPSVVASYNTDTYRSNAGTAKKLQLVSEDKFLNVTIDPSSLPADANCSFAKIVSDLPHASGVGKKIVGGPYKLICQQQDGSVVKTFKQPVAITATLSDKMANNYDEIEFQTYSSTTNSWRLVPVKQDGRTIELSSTDMALVALARPRSMPLWQTVLLTGGIGSLAIPGFFGVKWYLRLTRIRQLADVRFDFWRKNNGL